MAKHWIAAVALTTALSVAPALRGDNGKHKEHGKGHEKHAYAHEEGWERRGDFEYRTFGRGEHPPGWNQGRKTGWGNCGMPPGQAKKYGCRSFVYQGRQHYYYQDNDRRIVVRRPIIAIHGSIDIVK